MGGSQMTPPKTDLLLSDLFRIDDCTDIHFVGSNDWQNPGRSDVPDPIGAIVAKFADELHKNGVADFSWDAEMTVAPVEKRFTNPLNFAKGTVGYKLQITRIEEKIDADGDKWAYAYAGDELVDARVVNSFL
jgi:hypothetical protein